MNDETSAPAPRSTFVTILAWVFIVLSGLGTLISLFQTVMFFTVFRAADFDRAMHTVPAGIPPMMGFMVDHMAWVFPLTLAIFALTFVSAIGLLRRLNWARFVFVGLMAWAILWQLLGLTMQWGMMSFMRGSMSAAAAHGSPDLQPFLIGFAVISLVMAAAFCFLFGWIIKRLLSPQVAAEFRR